MSDSGSHSGNTGMFGIFILTIATIVLVPYTLYALCNVSEENAAWADSKVGERWWWGAQHSTSSAQICDKHCHLLAVQGKKKKSSIGTNLKRLATKGEA